MAVDLVAATAAITRVETSIVALKVQLQQERAIPNIVEQAVEEVKETNAAVERRSQQRLIDIEV